MSHQAAETVNKLCKDLSALHPKSNSLTTQVVSRRAAIWLGTVALLCLGFSTAFVVLTTEKDKAAYFWGLSRTPHGRIVHLIHGTGTYPDSLMPMLRAHKRLLTDPTSSPYAVFFLWKGKFQYPPNMLLLPKLLPEKIVNEAIERWNGSVLQYWNGWVSRLSILVTIILSTAILRTSLHKVLGENPPQRLQELLALAVVTLGVSFYPFILGYELGQFQLLLNALVAAALLFFIKGRKLLAGVFFGLCCLIKPQYGLILVWSVLRKEQRLSVGFLLPVFPIVMVSCVYFGLSAFSDYMEVLRILAKRSEVFWYNQSLAGLLHRFVDPGAANFLDKVGSPLPPYRAWIYFVSTLTSICILLYAFIARAHKSSGENGRLVDLATIIVAATIASPVAWNHHYGTFFPIFMAILPVTLQDFRGGRVLALLLAVAFMAIAFEIELPDKMFESRWTGLLASHIFFGGLVLLGVMVTLQRKLSRDSSQLEL
jgi:alpha-1,2-mannosyltransferase